MRENIIEFIPKEKPCSYLKEERSLFRYFHIEECSSDLYQALLERGWRRFGKYFFVPICKNCKACLSVRKPLANLEFSRSFKRVLSKNRQTGLVIQRPMITEAHLKLYDRYHRRMSEKKGWEYSPITMESYYEMFVEGSGEFGYEFAYYRDERLVGIALVDILERSLSAVYCFYDHDYSDFSLGIFSILKQLELAKRLKIDYFYPGYWIKNHPSMGYKERFAPYEILRNEPDIDALPEWSLQGENE
ncbi:arginyltransferase [Wolinella succinogenes]|uniref:Aspartate/glutamate leucyltransferase n=1 Tax=Wolinella succinogenes (strain ATCC 29543 / DSM 1740 / CCUG 13145 / JCM 31913 / LMG 7466 / NCTC 11488 / FDC 602W) TaxID=273121 RepID=Q7M907_WOLSU|nr:arginyltransferase [Wolinella succinogenes]NLU34482.1 arginyltransferase [Wolinella succinogenes]CAE10355.1 POSSIBLE TRANSFERASE [Wolinella succinogenes]VEG80402.1 arginyl-tRNA-protein transferase [Wolinella succinogenes]HCZ19776.1 arginyltransferase [Helicobacter sp.]